jgi:hypothetical protein
MTADPLRLSLILNSMAEAIHERIFDEPLGPEGTIERALYREVANEALRAGLAAWLGIKTWPDHCENERDELAAGLRDVAKWIKHKDPLATNWIYCERAAAALTQALGETA